MDASHIYVRALALGCFYSRISTLTFRRTLTASLDSWRVPESEARSVHYAPVVQADPKRGGLREGFDCRVGFGVSNGRADLF